MINLREIIHRIQSKTAFNQKQIAEQLFEISNNNLNNKIRRNSIDILPIVKWAMNENVSLDWLLIGKTPVQATNQPSSVSASEAEAMGKIIADLTSRIKTLSDINEGLQSELDQCWKKIRELEGEQPAPDEKPAPNRNSAGAGLVGNRS